MKFYTSLRSPLGDVTIQASDEGITGLWFETHTTKPDDLGQHQPSHAMLVLAAEALEKYFAGKPVPTLPIAAEGTEFQRAVWHQLTLIPVGETRSYQDLADAIGKPKAVRAVGAANGKNPVSIFVPCHRVIGKSGALTGYAGGVERKAWLLKHEGIVF